MDSIQKLYTDIRKIAKHGRTEDLQSVCETISHRFSALFPDLGILPESVADYWVTNRILNSAQPENEPSEKNLLWLITAADILNGTYSENGQNEFSAKDWEQLRDMVRYEAEDLPLDKLTELMSLFVAKKIL